MKPIAKELSFCGIYMIINTKNNHRYIGSSLNIRHRLWEHRALLRHNKHCNPHLQNAWNKYGEDSFEYTVLESCEASCRFEREQFYITTFSPEYNICLEAINQPPVTEQSKRKHSETRKRLMAEGKIAITNNTPVYVYYKDGSFVGMWKSIRKASAALNISSTGISCCLNGKYTQWRGYKFFREKRQQCESFSKPKSKGSDKIEFKVVDVLTGDILLFLGREAIAEYFNTTSKTIGIYIGGKHKLKNRYMIYRNSAV